MTTQEEVDYIVHDCFFAIGQNIPLTTRVKYDVIEWWQQRYRERFLVAMTSQGASWARDRRRVTSVARFLGLRAAHYAGDGNIIDRACAERASIEVEAGCQLRADCDKASRLPVAVLPVMSQSTTLPA